MTPDERFEADEKDRLLDKVAELRQQLAILKNELKSIGKALNDPRVDLTMTMSEVIMELRQQLAERIASSAASSDAEVKP